MDAYLSLGFDNPLLVRYLRHIKAAVGRELGCGVNSILFRGAGVDRIIRKSVSRRFLKSLGSRGLGGFLKVPATRKVHNTRPVLGLSRLNRAQVLGWLVQEVGSLGPSRAVVSTKSRFITTTHRTQFQTLVYPTRNPRRRAKACPIIWVAEVGKALVNGLEVELDSVMTLIWHHRFWFQRSLRGPPGLIETLDWARDHPRRN